MGLHVVCFCFFFAILTKTEVCPRISVTFPNIKCHEEQSSGNRSVKRGLTDMEEERVAAHL